MKYLSIEFVITGEELGQVSQFAGQNPHLTEVQWSPIRVLKLERCLGRPRICFPISAQKDSRQTKSRFCSHRALQEQQKFQRGYAQWVDITFLERHQWSQEHRCFEDTFLHRVVGERSYCHHTPRHFALSCISISWPAIICERERESGFLSENWTISVFVALSFRQFALQKLSTSFPWIMAALMLMLAALTPSAWAELPTFKPEIVRPCHTYTRVPTQTHTRVLYSYQSCTCAHATVIIVKEQCPVYITKEQKRILAMDSLGYKNS